MHQAAFNGHGAIVSTLLEADAEVDLMDLEGSRPIHLACLESHTLVVRMLLKAKADVDSVDSMGRTPLNLALKNSKEELVKMLIDAGADVNKARRNERPTDRPTDPTLIIVPLHHSPRTLAPALS